MGRGLTCRRPACSPSRCRPGSRLRAALERVVGVRKKKEKREQVTHLIPRVFAWFASHTARRPEREGLKREGKREKGARTCNLEGPEEGSSHRVVVAHYPVIARVLAFVYCLHLHGSGISQKEKKKEITGRTREMERGSRRSPSSHGTPSNRVFPRPRRVRRPWATVNVRIRKKKRKKNGVGHTKIEWVPHGLVIARRPVVPCPVTVGSRPQAWRSHWSKKMNNK